MEGVHGVDVSWLHHSPKGTSQSHKLHRNIPEASRVCEAECPLVLLKAN